MHCDGRKPSCAKCELKRIKCSGFGIRIRFRDDTHKKYAEGKVGGYRKFQPLEELRDLSINSYKRASGDSPSTDEEDEALRYHEPANSSTDLTVAPLREVSNLLDLDFLDETPLFETPLGSPSMVLDPIEGWRQFLFVHCESIGILSF